MITGSVVLYQTKKELLYRLISSFQPDENRILYIVDNSPMPINYSINNKYIRYKFLGKNIGYGAAHNIAIRRAIKNKSTYHIVLNPDIVFEPEVVDILSAYADENKNVVYMLPKVLYPNGDLQYLCKLLPTPFDLVFRRFLPEVGVFKRRNDRYTLKKTGYNSIINPPCLSGCFMFLRLETLKKERILFDERFFMYFEDFDLIRRLHRVGKTLYYPECTIVHAHEKASYKNKKMLLIHVKSAIVYFNKYGWFFDKERREMNKSILSEIR